MMSLISIVVVNKNNAAGLQNTLSSLRDQDFTDDQVIVVDGKSTDGSREVIESFSDTVDHATYDAGNGIYAAMNLGVEAASGEWILFLNSGDFFYDEHVLSGVAEQLEGDYCYGWVQRLGDDYEHRPRPLSDLWKSSVICHQALFTRTEILKERGFDLKYKIVADYEHYVWACNQGCRFKYIDRPITWIEPGGVSDRKEWLRNWERFKIARKAFPENPIYKHYLKEFLKIGMRKFRK